MRPHRPEARRLRFAGCGLLIRGFDLSRDWQAQLFAHDISVALIGPYGELTITGSRIGLDYGQRCLLACGIGIEDGRPVRGGPSELDHGGAAKVGQPHAGRIRPAGPWLLWQELAFKGESILERGAPPGARSGRAFEGRHGDDEVGLDRYGQTDERPTCLDDVFAER